MKIVKENLGKIKLGAAIFVIVAGAIFIVFTDNGLADYFQLKSEVKELHNEIISAQTRLENLQKEIDSLESSKKKIEKIAREEFLMKKQNEEAFKVEEK